MENPIRIAALIIGFLIGFFIYDNFFVPETESITIVVEKRTTDTLYIYQRDTVYRTEFKYVYERDTIIENYRPKIRGFKELYPSLYGNVSIWGEVLGELRFMNVGTEFKLPTIVNTIEKTTTTTIVKKPTGLYTTGGINSEFQYSVGATYINNKSLLGYEYQPQLRIHSAKVGWKIF